MLSKRTFEYWQVMVRTERGVVRRLRVEYLTEILEVHGEPRPEVNCTASVPESCM